MFFLAQEFFDDTLILNVVAEGLNLILMLSAPMLLSALGVGLVISIIQATTQVQEQTLSFVPKIIATFLAVIISGPWIYSSLQSYTEKIFDYIGKLGPPSPF